MIAVLPRASRIAELRSDRSALARMASELPDGGAIAIPIVGGAPRRRERASRALRAARALRLATASAWMRVLAARAGAALRDAGLRPERLDVGRPEDGHPIGLGGRRVPLAPNALVVGYREDSAPAPLDDAIEAAGHALGARLAIEGARVLASGVLMVELASPAGRYLLRIAGPGAAASLVAAEAILERLLACRPPSAVRERLVVTVARGPLGPMRWSLEPRRVGAHPAAVDKRLWGSCLEFLVALHSTPAVGPAPLTAALSADVRVLEPHLHARERRPLAELERRLLSQLDELERGWGHGDFHPGNLLIDRGALATVLDWDAAEPGALPLLDVLHLIATSEPSLRRLPHGARCSGTLWPLAEAGEDPRIRSYCEATGTPSDPPTLLALAHAYWLTRVARDLREFADRAGREEWLELNLRRPLSDLRW